MQHLPISTRFRMVVRSRSHDRNGVMARRGSFAVPLDLLSVQLTQCCSQPPQGGVVAFFFSSRRQDDERDLDYCL